jgi:protoporphyrinogen oxidase
VASDERLIAMARSELAVLGLADSSKVVDRTVVRQSKAYPMYDHDYRANLGRVRTYLALAASNLQVAGRNGMHKYDNQDHAILTGLSGPQYPGRMLRSLASQFGRRVSRRG